MPKLVTYRCPDCKGEFDFLHHPSDEPPPENCELCNSYMGDKPQKAPVLYLNLGKERNKVPDQLYRKMEKASEERAEDAAEMAGASVAEMSAVKITNMKDNMRAGDTAAVTRVSPVQAMTNLSTAAAKPEMQNPNAAAWAQETTSGPAALSTRSLIKDLQSSGRANMTVASATQRGQMGKF